MQKGKRLVDETLFYVINYAWSSWSCFLHLVFVFEIFLLRCITWSDPVLIEIINWIAPNPSARSVYRSVTRPTDQADRSLFMCDIGPSPSCRLLQNSEMTQHGIERSFQNLNMNDSPGTTRKIPPAVAPKPSKVLNTSPKPFKAGTRI